MADSVTGVSGVGGAGGAGGSSNPFGSMMVDALEQSLSSNGQAPTGETKKALDTLRDALKGNQKDAAKQAGEGSPTGGAEGAGAPQGSQGGGGKQDKNGILQMLQQIMQMLQQLMQMVAQGDQGGQGTGTGTGTGQPGFQGTPGATDAAGQLPGTSFDQIGDSLVNIGTELDGVADAIPA